MQVLKEEIQKQILRVAQKHFLKRGYMKTTMREIAKEAGVGVGNIYNYFPNKDVLFQKVVEPATSMMEKLLQSHHGTHCEDVMVMLSESYYERCVDEYVMLLNRHRDLMTILFFRAQGSSMEDYFDIFSDHATDVTLDWLVRIKESYPELKTDVMNFTIHLHVVWMFSLLKELLMHNMRGDDMHRALSDYLWFEIQGWKQYINNYSPKYEMDRIY